MILPKIMYRLPNQPLTNGRFTTVWQKVSATAGTMLCRYLIDYLYVHVCDYNTNRLKIEANTERILERQDEILARVNELRCPLTIMPPNVNGLFIRGYHFKLRYVVIVAIAILAWAVAASVSSMKYKEESFAHYSMYRAVKEQHQSFIEKWVITKEDD